MREAIRLSYPIPPTRDQSEACLRGRRGRGSSQKKRKEKRGEEMMRREDEKRRSRRKENGEKEKLPSLMTALLVIIALSPFLRFESAGGFAGLASGGIEPRSETSPVDELTCRMRSNWLRRLYGSSRQLSKSYNKMREKRE